MDTTIAKLASKFNFLSKSINAKNNLDIFIFLSEMNSNLEEVKKELQEIIERGFNAVERMLKGQGNAKLVFDAFFPIFFPACKKRDACQEKKRILLKQSKILVGCILRAFVKKERFHKINHGFTLQSDGSYLGRKVCWVDCSRECPDIEDGCWSSEACTKNLFYDTEKC